MVLYNLKNMDFTFKTLSEIVGPNQTINDLKIEKIIDVYLNNLVKQFQAGDKSYKFSQDIKIQNYNKFYDELTRYDKELFIDWDCVNLKDQDFLIKEIEDIRSVEEKSEYINVIYDNGNQNDCHFKYSEKKIIDDDHELFDGKYKKYTLYKQKYSKRCVFGQLYSRVKKDNAGRGVASDKYKKSYEYLDLSGYLLYDYVHNYSKYAGNPICNHLNKFLEEQILNILDIDNLYVSSYIERLETFTLYDIIYPNLHYIYNIKDKNFCLPVDRVICHYDENPENIGAEENLKYEKKLTVANFMQDIFGMSKNDIHKDIQDIFINCLNKKLFKLFTDITNDNLFYNKDLTFIFSDIIALFAFFIKFNDLLRKREKEKSKNNNYVLDIEIYKSINLIRGKKNKFRLLYSDLPFLYHDENLISAKKNNKKVNVLNFINDVSHDIESIDSRNNVLTGDLCSLCFQNIKSYVYANNFIIDVKKDELYKFIFDSMLRIGKFGVYAIIDGEYKGRKCENNQTRYPNTEDIIKGNGGNNSYFDDMSLFCVVNGTKNLEAQNNNDYVISNPTDINETNENVFKSRNINFYSGIYGLIILQTIFLNTVMKDETYDIMFRLYNMGIKFGFAQHYIWSHLMERNNKDQIIEYYSDVNLDNLPFVDNDIIGTDYIIYQLFKSIFLDTDTYNEIIGYNIKKNEDILKITNIEIYSSNNIFEEKKYHIFSNLLNYYNERMSKKIINFDSKELKIHKKKYRNIEMMQMIKKLTQNRIKLYFENNDTIGNIPKEEKKLSDEQKKNMMEIIGTVVKKIKPETGKINNAIKDYGELNDDDKKPNNNNNDDSIYKELLNDVNARHLFKGGAPYQADIIYTINNDIYSLLLLNYYDKLTVQKLKYYYLFNILLYSNYLIIDITDHSFYMSALDMDGLIGLFWPRYGNINLFITDELTNNANVLLKNISYLIHYYFYGINYQFLKIKEHTINNYYDATKSPHGQLLINSEAIRKFDDSLDQNNELFKVDIIKETFKEINDQIPDDIKIKENNNLKQNINNQGQIIMQSNNNGIYSLTQMPEITKQNLTEGNNINVSFLNNNGLLPFLLSRNLNKEILKGGDKLFNRAASAFGQIRHMSISDIINLYRKGGNNVLNVEQMTFLKNAERLDKEREEEYNLIIGVINYIRDAIKRENIPEKDLETFDKGLDEMRKTGFKAAKTIELQNLHKQKGGKDIPDILTKLKQGQYRRQQIDNNYIEELNNYLKSF